MKKNNLIFSLVAVVIIVGLLSVVVSGKKQQKVEPPKIEELEQTAPIPTIDSSVIVDVKAKNYKRSVELSVSNTPSGTDSIEYAISYETKQQSLQGIQGMIDVIPSKNNYVITRDLGTCSSGTCIYHEVVGSVKVELKFSGTYGEKIFDKEYEI
ncbi:hypothetical protein HY358_00905 [Candidatus Roizmanbacteria bacterium]|nr:hypothetical protein [Candidatus Roizmanbacteria bacterium]